MGKIKLTLHECANLFREYGHPITTAELSDDLAAGLYPFGRMTGVGPTGRRKFRIYRVKAEQWLKEMGGEAQ